MGALQAVDGRRQLVDGRSASLQPFSPKIRARFAQPF